MELEVPDMTGRSRFRKSSVKPVTAQNCGVLNRDDVDPVGACVGLRVYESGGYQGA